MQAYAFWGSVRVGWVVGVVAGGILGWAPVAAAGDCGGSVPCGCGDTVVASTTLSNDIGGCPKAGLLVVGTGVILDCNFKTLTGILNNGRDNGGVGIHLDPATNSEVRNCTVTGFRQGIRIGSGLNNRIVNNDVFGNRKYGIEVAGASTGNVLQGNRVGKPNGTGVRKAEEGIHNGSGSHGTVIRENVVLESKDENIYVLNSNNVQVIMNTVSGSDNAAIFLKNSNGTHVAQNTVATNSITVRGDSAGNTLVDNTISNGKGYLFEAHVDEAASGDPSPGFWRYPRRNTVIGGSVIKPIKIPVPGTTDEIRPCLRFQGSYKNTVSGLQLDPTCTQPSQVADGGQESVGNEIGVMPLPQ